MVKTGAWEYSDMKPCELPPDAAYAFRKAAGSIVGVKYTPVLFVASQLANGMNYCIICKSTVLSNPPAEGCKAVFIYEDTKGNCSITKIDDIIE